MAVTEQYRDCTVEWRHMGEAFGAMITLPNGNRIAVHEGFGDMPTYADFQTWVRMAIDARLLTK